MSAEFTALFIIRDESSESKRNFSFWGTLGFSVLRFSLFFRSVFRFLCQKTSAFRFYCSLRFADFSFFRIWFSVFVENDSGFSLLLSNVVCIRFSVLAEFFGGFPVLMTFFHRFRWRIFVHSKRLLDERYENSGKTTTSKLFFPRKAVSGVNNRGGVVLCKLSCFNYIFNGLTKCGRSYSERTG